MHKKLGQGWVWLGLVVAVTGCQWISGGDGIAIEESSVTIAGKGAGGRDGAGGAAGDEDEPDPGGHGGHGGDGGHAGVPAAGHPAGAGGHGGVPPEPPVPDCPGKDADAECDRLNDCGCVDDDKPHCVVLGSERKETCTVAGQKQAGEPCAKPEDCETGTCDERVCRPYCSGGGSCEGGKCLPATDSAGEPIAGLEVCKKICQVNTQDTCFRGTTCQVEETTDGKLGFCKAPADPCPTVWDGKCDEPNICALGTDTMDCSCERTVEDWVCDLVNQCGCEKGEACNGNGGEPKCITPGKVGRDGRCASEADCELGGCYGPAGLRVCRPYCNDHEDCPGSRDRCLQTTFTENGVTTPIEHVLACLTACGGPGEAPCGDGSACTFVSDYKVAYCLGCEPEIADAECGVMSQCGCALENAGCVLYVNDANQVDATCLRKTGSGVELAPCADNRDCGGGHMCLDNMCRPPCMKPEDCTSGSCVTITVDGVEAPIGLCVRTCTPGQSGECGAGRTCETVAFDDGSMRSQCVLIPLTEGCPTANGACDGPEAEGGDGLCAAGVDPECMTSMP